MTGIAKTAAQLNAEIEARWPDNSSRLITPAAVRATVEDIVASSALLLETATFAPGSVQPAVVVNGPNGLTPSAAVTINKGTTGDSALDIKQAGDNQGKLLRLMGPGDVAQNDPVMYFTTGGNFNRGFTVISGSHSGHGQTYNILTPSNDPFMFGIWADVNMGMQMRAAAGLDNASSPIVTAAYTILNGSGKYTGARWWDGTISWGSVTNSAFSTMDAFLARGGAALLQLGGPDNGSPVAQTLSAASVSAPFTLQGFLYTKVLTFSVDPVGVTAGMSVQDITNPAEAVATSVVSVDHGAKTVTLDNYVFPYTGDTIRFGGSINLTLLSIDGPAIGYNSVPPSLVAGQAVVDITNGGAIPGGTTVLSVDPNAAPGAILVTLSANIVSTIFQNNTLPLKNPDVVQYSTPNTAAADFSVAGAKGTGTGNGGKVLIKAAPASGSGSSQNSLATYITVDPNPATGTPETQIAKGLKAGFYATAAPTTQTGATYSVGATDTDIIANASGTLTLTLPAAASFVGRELYVKTIAAHTVVSASSNVSPIDSATPGTAILAGTSGKWARLKSDGSNWIIMAGN